MAILHMRILQGALIKHRTWDMIGVMEDIAEYSMSYFDTAKNKGKHAPENFYHGLVLGLIVSMRKEYRIVSNREARGWTL